MNESLEQTLDKKDFVVRFGRFILDNPERGMSTLDGLYAGKSQKIHLLIKEAYDRGVRSGIGAVWEGRQRIYLA